MAENAQNQLSSEFNSDTIIPKVIAIVIENIIIPIKDIVIILFPNNKNGKLSKKIDINIVAIFFII